MIQIQNLNCSLGIRELFTDINWTIKNKKRTALLGPNGAGKTTLLRILTRENTIDYSGNIKYPNNFRIGYLPQEEIDLGEGTILSKVLDSFEELVIVEKKIEIIQEKLNINGISEQEENKLLRQLDDEQRVFESLNGYEIESEAKKILSGLGFKTDDFLRNISEFSGGWRMRTYLASILLKKPNLLLLDEPTNHLDIESMEWLEKYLINFDGTVVFVSHDRFFIDRISEEIVEIDHSRMEFYSGNYSFYINKKEEKEKQLEKKWKEQKEERERLEKFINRFRYQATKAKQVQSRVKELEKLEVLPILRKKHTFNFSISVSEKSYNEVLTIQDASFKYDKDWVLKDMNFNLYREEKIALVGVNGAGKTTMTKLIAEQLIANKGKFLLGEKVKIGYYAQHQVDSLNLDNSIYDEIMETTALSIVPKIKDVLGLFQFKGADINKKIRVLSGGEKARVSLAKILISPVNFLIMDEPTNHLDKESKAALEKALIGYNGTLILISHDRYFLDRIVSKVIEIKEHHLNEFSGNYSYYLKKRDNIKTQTTISNQFDDTKSNTDIEDISIDKKEKKRLEALARQKISKERNIIAKKISEIEKRIIEFETREEEIKELMLDSKTYEDKKLVVNIQKELSEIQKKLEANYNNWEIHQKEFEELMETII